MKRKIVKLFFMLGVITLNIIFVGCFSSESIQRHECKYKTVNDAGNIICSICKREKDGNYLPIDFFDIKSIEIFDGEERIKLCNGKKELSQFLNTFYELNFKRLFRIAQSTSSSAVYESQEYIDYKEYITTAYHIDIKMNDDTSYTFDIGKNDIAYYKVEDKIYFSEKKVSYIKEMLV